MNRVMIVGCCGAGKSTLARKLHSVLGLELIHLDSHFWQPNWVEPNQLEWSEKVKQLVNKPQWIIDGNYTGTANIRLEKADTIVFLDYSTLHCLYRVIKRVLKYRGTVRPDLAEGCEERFNFEFLLYVANFKRKRGDKLLNKVRSFQYTKRVIILKSDKEITAFIEQQKTKLKPAAQI